jgi:predicted CXXCH cytochrome family protein
MEREDGAEAPQDPTSRRGTRVALLAVVILLLALTLCWYAESIGLNESISQRATFLARNSECLRCHTEVLRSAADASVHEPFLKQQCSSCHNQHTGLLEVRVDSDIDSEVTTLGGWLRWGPFRWVANWYERVVLRVSAESQRTSRQAQLGEATLVATPRTLCWTCHGNLRPERDRGYPHQPFASSNCVSCHNPHSSKHTPLLKVSSEDLCVTCHPIGRELARAFTHPPVEQLDCMDCHEAHASDHNGILVAAQRDLCFTCHPSIAAMSTRAVQHQPVVGDNCTGCHEPHGAEEAPLLKDATPQLCYRCHSSIEPRFARASHHPVGVSIECESCHEVHASQNDALLVQPQSALCVGCHTDIAALASLPSQHEPFSDEPCTACHVPHGSQYGPLLRNPQPNICYRCHPQIGVAMQRDSHHPEECSRCHGVHAASHDKLLFADAGNDLCYSCHPTISLSYLQSPHSRLVCVDCHVAHGSQFGALRREEPTSLCSSCHKADEPHIRFVGEGAHRATPQFFDVHAEAPLTCTSSCHNPHGTPYLYMMRDLEWYFDGTCLRCHKGVGVRF